MLNVENGYKGMDVLCLVWSGHALCMCENIALCPTTYTCIKSESAITASLP